MVVPDRKVPTFLLRNVTLPTTLTQGRHKQIVSITNIHMKMVWPKALFLLYW
jgi:hypothetical protein